MSESSRLECFDTELQSAAFRMPSLWTTQTARSDQRDMKAPGEYLAVYWLESGFERTAGISHSLLKNALAMRKRWERADGWLERLLKCLARPCVE